MRQHILKYSLTDCANLYQPDACMAVYVKLPNKVVQKMEEPELQLQESV